MQLLSSETHYLGQILSLLIAGERLAHDCAIQQARYLTPIKPKEAKFLMGQARHEALHAKLFAAAQRWLTPSHQNNQLLAPLENYQQCIATAIQQGQIAESVFALQILLEGMGEVVLQRLNARAERYQFGLSRLRRMILGQEAAHHHFGLTRLQDYMHYQGIEQTQLRRQAQPYLELSWQLLEQMAPVFAGLDEDPDSYWQQLTEELPAWLRP